jgi:hypothetical protein
MRALGKIITAVTAVALATLGAAPKLGLAADFVVYSVYKGLDMGNPDEKPQKDYYVNMGSAQGLHAGSKLEVMRRVATYDLLSEKLYKDVTFPIAQMKVIHVENNAAICRLDKVLPPEKMPAVANPSVMVGDVVRQPE